MERLTKLQLVAWAASALAFEARLLSGGWPLLPLLMAASLAGAAVASFVTPRAVVAVLLPTYVVQVLVRLAVGGPHYAPPRRRLARSAGGRGSRRRLLIEATAVPAGEPRSDRIHGTPRYRLRWERLESRPSSPGAFGG